MGTSTSFVTDLQIQTLNYLEQLLSNEFKAYKSYIDWPPSQQQECVLISVLHLLTLQVNLSLFKCNILLFLINYSVNSFIQ